MQVVRTRSSLKREEGPSNLSRKAFLCTSLGKLIQNLQTLQNLCYETQKLKTSILGSSFQTTKNSAFKKKLNWTLTPFNAIYVQLTTIFSSIFLTTAFSSIFFICSGTLSCLRLLEIRWVSKMETHSLRGLLCWLLDPRLWNQSIFGPTPIAC